VASSGDRDQPHFHHLPERQEHPHVESGGRDGGERGGPDQAADPDGIDEVEAEWHAIIATAGARASG